MSEGDKTPEADAEDIAETPADAEPAAADGFAALEGELAEAKQAVLYAQAEVLNVRRRAEKEEADARTYAATGFARDILSVSDNLLPGPAAQTGSASVRGRVVQYAESLVVAVSLK